MAVLTLVPLVGVPAAAGKRSAVATREVAG